MTTPLPPLPEPEGERFVGLTPAVYAMWERQMKAYAFAARADLEAAIERKDALLRQALEALLPEAIAHTTETKQTLVVAAIKQELSQ